VGYCHSYNQQRLVSPHHLESAGVLQVQLLTQTQRFLILLDLFSQIWHRCRGLKGN